MAISYRMHPSYTGPVNNIRKERFMKCKGSWYH